MSETRPYDLELLRSFVNTNEPDQQTDELDTPEQLHGWLVARELIAADSAIDDEAHHDALEFREAVRALALANGGAELDTSAIATLDRLGAKSSLSVRMLANGRAVLRPADRGIHEVLGHLFSILYTAMVDGSFRRLKGCANDTCRWLFYDKSKNRSRKWCEMQTCGNVINARAYRRRRRDDPADRSPSSAS